MLSSFKSNACGLEPLTRLITEVAMGSTQTTSNGQTTTVPAARTVDLKLEVVVIGDDRAKITVTHHGSGSISPVLPSRLHSRTTILDAPGSPLLGGAPGLATSRRNQARIFSPSSNDCCDHAAGCGRIDDR